MKKIAVILLSCAVSTIVSAQTVLWDGEDTNITSRNEYGGFWDRGNPSVVNNPEKDGINTSNKCLKFTMTGNEFGQKHVACPFRDWMTLNMNGRRRVSLMIRKTTSENVLIELSDPTNGDANYWQNVAAWYNGAGKWQKLVFDFSTNTGLNDFPGVIAITAQTGSVTSNEDVWIDNIVVEDLPAVNNTPLKDIADGTLSGPLTLTGGWAKGSCSKVDGDTWTPVNFDDFATLSGKMTSGITSVDLRGASLKNAQNVFAAKNPNVLIFANQLFADDDYIATGENAPVIYYKPTDNYVGDPMPCYIDGEFKVLYLFERPQNGETYHPFHLLTSDNLSSFTEQGEVLPTGNADSWDAAPGTGCMVKKGDTYYIFYSGNYLSVHSPSDYRQTVLRATSTDGLHWTKDGSWHLQAPADGWHKNEFRDPQVWEDNGTWHMVLGAMKWNGSANMPVVAEYTSTDLTTWAGPTVVVEGNNPANFYECPDVFKIGDRTYLVYSEINGSDRKVHYLYKPDNGTWTVPTIDVLDGQGFYAGKTASDGTDRYIFGWCDRRSGNTNDGALAWGGSLVTHKLYRKSDGTLALTVPHTFLPHYNVNRVPRLKKTSGTVSQSGSTYTMEAGSSLSFGRLKQKNGINVTFTASNNTNEIFGFSFVDNSDKDAVYTLRINLQNQKIYYNKDSRSGEVSEINQAALPHSDNGVYNIRIYNDQSVCVLYVNDEVAFTNRIYGMPRNPWKIICEQGSVTVQNLVWKTN